MTIVVARPEAAHRILATVTPAASEPAAHLYTAAEASHMATATEATAAVACIGCARRQG